MDYAYKKGNEPVKLWNNQREMRVTGVATGNLCRNLPRKAYFCGIGQA